MERISSIKEISPTEYNIVVNNILVDMDSSGTPQWCKSYSQVSFMGSLDFFTDGSIHLYGTTSGGELVAIKSNNSVSSVCFYSDTSLSSSAVSIFSYSATIQALPVPLGFFNIPLQHVDTVTISTLCGPVSVSHHSFNTNIPASPNPFSTSTTITFESRIHEGHIIVYDLSGKEVKRKQIADAIEINLERSTLNEGLYFFKVVEGFDSRGIGKLVIEN